MLIKSSQRTQHISVVKRCKIPGWPNVGAHQSTLDAINLAPYALHIKPQNWEPLPLWHSSFYTLQPRHNCDVNIII